jgi:hypothetical protein
MFKRTLDSFLGAKRKVGENRPSKTCLRSVYARPHTERGSWAIVGGGKGFYGGGNDLSFGFFSKGSVYSAPVLVPLVTCGEFARGGRRLFRQYVQNCGDMLTIGQNCSSEQGDRCGH